MSKIKVLCTLAAAVVQIFLFLPQSAYAIDYQELQQAPLESALKKLISSGDIEWDKEEMISGGAPDVIKNMRWPVTAKYISRGFKRRGHKGVDLIAPKGTPIYAVLDGVVEVVSNGRGGFRGYGNVILINHGGKLWSLYSHNSSNKVKIGQKVKRGELIATVGSTGHATANHLHFEVRNSRGTPLDPLKYLPKEGAPPRR
ncbi:MAG: M23 family metallopeptidase [Synergistes sp.]|nr:M23 family metallopeptidase [Synergistes sp.]